MMKTQDSHTHMRTQAHTHTHTLYVHRVSSPDYCSHGLRNSHSIYGEVSIEIDTYTQVV